MFPQVVLLDSGIVTSSKHLTNSLLDIVGHDEPIGNQGFSYKTQQDGDQSHQQRTFSHTYTHVQMGDALQNSLNQYVGVASGQTVKESGMCQHDDQEECLGLQ